jgi:hypothetical protein
MKKYAETMSLWLLLAVSSSASSPAAGADECFCMSHASGAILRGCESYKAPNDAYATAICTDPETGKTSQQTMYSEWTLIKDGTGVCAPCRPPPAGLKPLRPRGDDPPRQSK